MKTRHLWGGLLPAVNSHRIEHMRLMTRTAVLVLLLLSTVACRAAETDWDPAKSWVFIVGLLEWKHPKFLPPFPKAGRRDSILATRFKDLGVPAENIVLMQDKAATTGAVRDALTAFAARPAKGDTLFVYFCGHGYHGDDGVDYLATYDAEATAWSVPQLFDEIEMGFRGRRAVLLADCCNSGAIPEQAKRRKAPIDYGCLVSVKAGDVSTNNWTFSDSLLDVLEGQPQADLDGDGVTTFEEASRFIEGEMQFFEKQAAASSHTGGLQSGFRLSAVKQPKSNKRIGEHVEVLWEGEWWRALIVGAEGGKYKVRYASPATREEGLVDEKNIRAVADAAAGEIVVGSAVKVEWKKRWWPAKVVKVDADAKKYYITYDGYGKEWDEWVPPARIRLRR
jgi:hypothetical protein